MLIGTMEALDRTRPGQTVSIEGHTWERVAEGFRSADGEVLPLIAFRGLADEGKIRSSDDPGWSFPSWRRNGDYYFLLIREDPVTGGILTACFQAGVCTQVSVYAEAMVVGWTTPRTLPDINDFNWSAAMKMMADHLTPASVFTGPTSPPSALITDLHTLAAKVAGLDEVLNKHQVGRRREGEVTVSAQGTAQVTADLFGGTVEMDSTEVPWRFVYAYPASSLMTDPCLCLTFDTVRYEARLPVNVVTNEYHIECSEPDCVNRDQEPARKRKS